MTRCSGCGDPVAVAVDAYGLAPLCRSCGDEVREAVDELIVSVEVDELLRLAKAAGLLPPDEGADS